MAEQIQGVPAGLAEENLSTPEVVQGVPAGLQEETLPSVPSKVVAPPKEVVQGVPSGLTEEDMPKTPKPEKDTLTSVDESPVLSAQQQLAVKGARAVRGLYHGVMGDQETAASRGETTTASPEVAQLGFTPEHVGYKFGEMARGVGKFAIEAGKDLLSNTPTALPNEVTGKPTASFWDRVKTVGDPEAHTLMAKYVTAPSLQERESSEKELEKYYETHGIESFSHALTAFLHGTLGEYIPAIGPLAMSLTDQAAKGDIGGTMSQLASLYAFEKGTGAAAKGIKERVGAAVDDIRATPEMKTAAENTKALAQDRAAAQTKYDTAKAKHDQHIASHEQGIESPKPVKTALDKAKAELDEATAHHELATEREARLKTAQPTIPQQVGGAAGSMIASVLGKKPVPEVPAEEMVAQPPVEKPVVELGRLGGTPPPVSPAHATDTFPQEPAPAPQTRLGRIALAGEQGTMGKQLMLPEKATAGLAPLEAPKPEPVAPKPAPVTDEAALRALEAKKGQVVDNIEKRVGELLKQALNPKPVAEAKTEPVRLPPTEQSPFAVTERANDTIARDQMMPKHPAEEVAPKKEELVPVGNLEEAKRPVKSAEEYHPMVEQKVNELSDENLRKLARAHGLNPDEYDFNARDDHRHRIERDQLAKEVTEQMGEDEKINLGRAAESSEGEGTFQSKDMSAKGRAERAAKMFPRLRGPVDEFGNPKASGASQGAENEEGIGGLERWSGKNPLEKPSVRPQTERVNLPNEGKAQPFEGATPDWQGAVLEARKALNKARAIKGAPLDEFGNPTVSGGSQTADDDLNTKHQKAVPDFNMIKDVEGKPDRLEIFSEGEPVGHLKVEEEVPGTWTVKDAVVKNQQKGIGSAAYLQLFDEARKAGVKTVESDISITKGATALWQSLMRRYPEAITEENGRFTADPNKVQGETTGLTKLGEKKKKSPLGKIVP